MDSVRTPAFQRFLDSFENRRYERDDGEPFRGDWERDTYAMSGLSALPGHERALAEALLIARLRDEDDAKCVEPLARLDTPGGRVALQHTLANGRGEARAAAAFRLRDPDVAVAMLDDPDREARLWALAALGRIGGSAARPGLVKALANDDWTISWLAGRLLLRELQFPVTERFEQLFSVPRCRLPGSREERPALVDEMVALLGALRRRETAEGLGYVARGAWASPALADLRQSLYAPTDRGPYARDLDLGSLDTTNVDEVAEGVALLVHWLTAPDYPHDVRLPRALLRLDARATVEEMALAADPAVSACARAALDEAGAEAPTPSSG